MLYTCTVHRLADGTYEAVCADPALRATGPTAADATRALESEIRYWFELCPCTTNTVDRVELDVRGDR